MICFQNRNFLKTAMKNKQVFNNFLNISISVLKDEVKWFLVLRVMVYQFRFFKCSQSECIMIFSSLDDGSNATGRQGQNAKIYINRVITKWLFILFHFVFKFFFITSIIPLIFFLVNYRDFQNRNKNIFKVSLFHFYLEILNKIWKQFNLKHEVPAL